MKTRASTTNPFANSAAAVRAVHVFVAVAAASCLLSSRAAMGAELVSAVSTKTNAVPLVPLAGHTNIASTLAAKLQQEHITRGALDDTLSARVWDAYLSALDPARMYFLQSDVDAFWARRTTLDEELARGSADFGFEVFRVFRERARERHQFVGTLLDRGLDVTNDETCSLKRKDAPWPRDRQEQDEIWRKRIENEYLQQVLAQEEIASNALAAAMTSNGVSTAGASAANTPPAHPDTPSVTNVPSQPPITNAAVSPAGTGTVSQAAGPATNAVSRPPPTPSQWLRDQYDKFLSSLEDIDADWVLQRYLSSLTHAYDPHCDYMSPPVAENFDISMKLSLVGIGAVLSSENGITKVVRIVPGGPAARDTRDIRLQAEDKIIAVAQGDSPATDVVHMPLDKVVRLIRGEKGTRVVLTIIPASDPTGTTRRHLDLIRDEVQLEEGSAQQDVREIVSTSGVTNRLGIITLPAFYSDIEARRNNEQNFKSSSEDIRKILASMATNNIRGVLLDLRNDGGGALVEAALVTGLFIPTGPVVQVLDRQRLSVLPDLDPSVAYEGPLVVLVNRFSASASEIVAAALQDYGRAVVVGDTKTHGKGTVQGVTPLSTDSQTGTAKITTALFFRITGSSTQLKGVSPDLVIPSASESMEVGEEFLDNPLQWMALRPASYSFQTGLADRLPVLVRQSEARRATSEKFSAYTNVLAHVAELRRHDDVSLSLDIRRQEATRSRELQERLRQLQDAATDQHEPKDMVLAEALHILADLADLDANRSPASR